MADDKDDRVRGRRGKILFGKDRMPKDASEEDKEKMREIYARARTSANPRGNATANRLANVGGYRHVNDGKGIAGQTERIDADSKALDYWYPDEDGKMVLRKGKRSRKGSHGTQSGTSVEYINRNDGGIAKKTRRF